ncbi:(2Fe-2S)-binding protein [Roseobacter ponti]|uniref:(2Fe-2S)-binding protein n=2 Tax=Roseobacter ponti TaxID=1891787 RepID=A0A858STM5_9RHOB|nr:(2Fe-2S)-binding protein [Roseobacter ponti]QJF51152.1 (2Fe-2S)-binding protein [Roseobacter ponti]
MKKMHISTTINGDETEFVCAPDETLLDVLRDRLALTGAKEGCGTGDCGACSVTLNGRLVCSCLVLGAEADAAEIGTIEGMATGDNLHVLQRVFIEKAALQCGICTPGILVAAKALLEKNPDPSETEIRYWLAGNLCRCTGYDKIIQAVQVAAAEMRSA